MTSIPTIQQLRADILNDLQGQLSVTINPFGKAFLRAKAWVWAAQLKLVYLTIANVQKNIFPDTADPEATGGTLERFGRVKLGRNPFPATQGQYTVSVTGTTGATIPASTTFRSDDNSQSPGLLYVLDAAYIFTSGSGTITLRALTGGTPAKLAVGNTLTATAPLLNADEAATVTAETVAPIDAETIEEYRQVVLQSFRLFPQGGASADYRLWGLEAQGVKQIYPYAASGAPNEVNVFVEATQGSSTDGKGTPTATILNTVISRIETDPVTGKGRRPLGVHAVNVSAVTINLVAITITGGTISSANRATITAALTEAVNKVRPFIPGADVLSNRNDSFGVNNIINTILTAVPGTLFTSVSMTVQTGGGPAVPTTVKVYDNGSIPFLDSVTYV